MDAAEAQERRRRARVAWAYSGLDQRELADKAGLNYDTVKAFWRKTGRAEPSLDDLHALARAAGIPRWFMDHGFAERNDDGASGEDSLEGLASQLREERAAREAAVAELKAQLADLAEAVRVGAAQLQEETPAASGVERSKLDEIFEDPRAEGADREHGGSTR